MFINEAIIQHLPGWLGIPFRFKRWDKQACDCVGLLVGILSEINPQHGFIKEYQLHNQGNYINGEVLLRAIKRFSQTVELLNVCPGDIALFTLTGVQSNHLGIVSAVDPLYMTHTDRMVKKVVENSIDLYWKEKLIGIFRLKA